MCSVIYNAAALGNDRIGSTRMHEIEYLLYLAADETDRLRVAAHKDKAKLWSLLYSMKH